MAGWAVIIFAKAPDPGRVKTRLGGAISPAERVFLYTGLLERTIGGLSCISGVDALISYAPEDAGPYFGRYGLPMFAQSGEGLGERMLNALVEALDARGYERAALVGADIPGLTAGVVLDALSALDRADVVFGPAEDGGYYLVGCGRADAGIFEGIEWSCPSTLEMSLARCSALGLRYALVRTLYDVDDMEGVRRYLGQGRNN